MKKVLITIGILFCLWLGISHVVFALRHPELTDTERLIRTKDALFFR